MKPFKIVMASIGSFLAVLILIFFLQFYGLVNYKFFAPKYQNAQRNVFENTQSYNEGKRQDLVKYYHEWLNIDKPSRQALKNIVLEDFANYDLEKLTPQERSMYNQITE